MLEDSWTGTKLPSLRLTINLSILCRQWPNVIELQWKPQVFLLVLYEHRRDVPLGLFTREPLEGCFITALQLSQTRLCFYICCQISASTYASLLLSLFLMLLSDEFQSFSVALARCLSLNCKCNCLMGRQHFIACLQKHNMSFMLHKLVFVSLNQPKLSKRSAVSSSCEPLVRTDRCFLLAVNSGDVSFCSL